MHRISLIAILATVALALTHAASMQACALESAANTDWQEAMSDGVNLYHAGQFEDATESARQALEKLKTDPDGTGAEP